MIDNKSPSLSACDNCPKGIESQEGQGTKFINELERDLAKVSRNNHKFGKHDG